VHEVRGQLHAARTRVAGVGAAGLKRVVAHGELCADRSGWCAVRVERS
jgi:hypothetical protein